MKFGLALRRAGFRTEMSVTGNPRKRFDKILRLDPAYIVKLDRRDGQNGVGHQVVRGEMIDVDRVRSIVDPLLWDLPEA